MLDDVKLCCMKSWMNFLRLHTSMEYQPSNIHGILVPFIQKFLLTNSIYSRKLKMEIEQPLMLVMLSDLMDLDDEIPTRV